MDMVVSQSELLERRQDWRKQGRRVVFTNGCFDLIHPGNASAAMFDSWKRLAPKGTFSWSPSTATKA